MRQKTKARRVKAGPVKVTRKDGSQDVWPPYSPEELEKIVRLEAKWSRRKG